MSIYSITLKTLIEFLTLKIYLNEKFHGKRYFFLKKNNNLCRKQKANDYFYSFRNIEIYFITSIYFYTN